MVGRNNGENARLGHAKPLFWINRETEPESENSGSVAAIPSGSQRLWAMMGLSNCKQNLTTDLTSQSKVTVLLFRKEVLDK